MRLGVAAALVGGELLPGDVDIARDGTIAAVGLTSSGSGSGVAAPGFVELQVNGVDGIDFSATDAEGYRVAGAALLATGVTAYQPTIVTGPEARMLAALAAIPPSGDGPRILGAHLEGPFLSPVRLGAHPPEHRRDPDLALLDRLLAAGPVRQMTLAPELAGAHALIGRLLAAGATVSLGHSDATAGEAHAAFDLGATTVTHLFNAMRPPSHRDPGIAYAALARDDVVVQLILDGHHLAPETALLAWRAAAGRLVLVTDAVAVGRTLPVTVRDGAVRLADGTLAGSVLRMDQAVRNLAALGAPVAAALHAASTGPARIARAAPLGSLAPGCPADVVVLDDELCVRRTLVAGIERYAT
jgi:N-acetylglucosamine-6-phosphate deacetylase